MSKSQNIPGSDEHHLWFDRKDYKTPTEKKFRNLRCQRVRIDFYAHRLLHNYLRQIPKPSREDMLSAIQRHERKLCSCYQE